MSELSVNSPVYRNQVNKLMRDRGITEEEADAIAHESFKEHIALSHTESAERKRAKTRERLKSQRKRLEFLLEALLPDSEEEITNELVGLGFDNDDTTQMDAVNLAVLKKAKKGDVEAARYLRDSSGNMPTSNVALGNMDDKPFTQLDLSALSTEELLKMLDDTKQE